MSDYNLSGLSTRSFEQLIQALAARLIGPNIIVFGDGPDGAREATFEGHIPYPTPAASWDGYGVVQAKFLQRPTNRSKDGQWAMEQLQAELRKFTDKKRSLRRPEYYIFATNVVLSPVTATGYKDKVYSLLRSYQGRIGLKDFDVWDFDKIRTFLDNNTDVRTAYAAWITSGDVLSTMIDALQLEQPKFDQVIANFLQKELISDLNANLQQAGHVTKDPVPLSAVFIDLRTSERRLYEPEREKLPLAPGFIAEVLGASQLKLDPDSLGTGPQSTTAGTQRIGKYVLIGGPGQGKTTLGQYICQLFRVALLHDRRGLIGDAKRAIDKIKAECTADRLSLPSARRFPIRIVLSEFAKALATDSSGIKSILSYITAKIRQRTNLEVNVTVFRRWIASYPWLLVLDGLDEVPTSSNRDQVLAAITDFWVDVTELNSDILTIATTRPQGYGNEFSPDNYLHHFLIPLSDARALRYASKLTAIRFGEGTDRQKQVDARLRKALSDDSTARLMRSPLQVTIMAELLDKVGQPPQERWTLFKDYYKVIYDREIEHGTPTSELLRQYRSDIDAIHFKAGLLLQLESERTGQTDAKLKTARFGSLVRAHFEDEGHSGTDLENLSTKVIAAASQRLVFLVGLEADQVGFEVRSLQEFMAAEALMLGDDDEVRDRLESIAALPNWRSVFLFAAGRCYVDRKYLRDTICAICAELNEGHGKKDNGLSVTKAGSYLAVDLLEDGTARSQPKHYRALARLGCCLLDFPPDEIHARIAGVYNAELESVLSDEITRRAQGKQAGNRAAAWTCAIQLESVGVPWAGRLLENATDDDLGAILEACGVARYSDRLGITFRRAISHVPPTTKALSIGVQKLSQSAAIGRGPWVEAVNELANPDRGFRRKERLANIQLRNRTQVLTASIVPMRPNWMHALRELPNPSGSWSPYLKANDFATSPSSATLSDALFRFADEFVDSPFSLGLPWPLALCLQACDSKTELLALAQQVAKGDLGEGEHWLAAEARWRDGVPLESVFGGTEQNVPFDSSIATGGFPTHAVMSIYLQPIPNRNLDELLNEIAAIPNVKGRGDIAAWALRTFRNFVGTPPPLVLEELLKHAADSNWSVDLSTINRFAQLSDATIEALNHVGLKAQFLLASSSISADRIHQIVNKYETDAKLTGLLRIIAYILPDAPIQGLTAPSWKEAQSFGNDLRCAALALRFATGVFETEDERALDSLLFESSLSVKKRNSYLDCVINALLKAIDREKADQVIVRMLGSLHALPGTSEKLMRALNVAFRKRRSSDRSIGVKLGLPASLL